MFTHGETVTRLRAPMVADPYSGAPTRRDWANATALQIPGCAVDPGGSDETQAVDRVQVVTTPRLFAPAGADVLTSDRIVSASGSWDVLGHGSNWSHPMTGWTPGLTFPLRRSDG